MIFSFRKFRFYYYLILLGIIFLVYYINLWSEYSYLSYRFTLKNDINANTIEEEESKNYLIHQKIVTNYISSRKHLNLSILGNILFKYYPYPKPRSKKFKILIWKYGAPLQNQHINNENLDRQNQFTHCSVKNCEITYDHSDITLSNAVVIDLYSLENFLYLPSIDRSQFNKQIWIFLSDENPKDTFKHSKTRWYEYSGYFNWSMTYKMESDIPVPYGRVVPLENPILPLEISEKIFELVPYIKEKKRSVLIAAFIYECNESLEIINYVKKLQRYMQVDVYGDCGAELNTACSSDRSTDCPQIRQYHFYLSFAKQSCNQYVTEDVFWNAYQKGAIPVIHGYDRETCETVLPPNSYLRIEEFANHSDLADQLHLLNNTQNGGMFALHRWRRHFRIVNEHDYYGSTSKLHCRVCEALNYNNETYKTYWDLEEFLSPEANCLDFVD